MKTIFSPSGEIASDASLVGGVLISRRASEGWAPDGAPGRRNRTGDQRDECQGRRPRDSFSSAGPGAGPGVLGRRAVNVVDFDARVAMSCSRRFGSFCRQRRNKRRMPSGVSRRQPIPVWLGLQDVGESVAHRVALERATPGQHLEQHAPERPHVGALVGGLTAGLLRRHVRGRTQNQSRPRGHQRRERSTNRGVHRRRGCTFANPKSSTLTQPSEVILMLAGFRSRWMIPCSCAASSASAICLAIGSGLVDREPATAQSAARDLHPRRVPSRARERLPTSRIRRSPRCGDDSARRGSWLRVQTARDSRGS